MNPSGRQRNQPKARRVCRDPRVRCIVLIDHRAPRGRHREQVGHRNPAVVNRPRPLLARCSIIVASAGRFATSTRPSSRSYQRNAGTRSTCRAACPAGWPGWCRGACRPRMQDVGRRKSTHRRRVGIVPDCSAHCRTGRRHPVHSRTKITPSTSGSAGAGWRCPVRRRRARARASWRGRRSAARSGSSSTTAAIQAAARLDQSDVDVIPGTISSATWMTTAWPSTATAPTASAPRSAPDTSTSTGLMTTAGSRRPPRPRAAAARCCRHPGPGAARPPRRAPPPRTSQATTIRSRSEPRILPTPRGLLLREGLRLQRVELRLARSCRR